MKTVDGPNPHQHAVSGGLVVERPDGRFDVYGPDEIPQWRIEAVAVAQVEAESLRARMEKFEEEKQAEREAQRKAEFEEWDRTSPVAAQIKARGANPARD
jgi:hypothetical protein